MTRGSRVAVLLLLVAAAGAGALLVAFAGSACPTELPGQPCPEAGRNQAIVIGLAAVSAGLLGAALAFLGELALRRGIAYRGAWSRAARRGLLVAAAIGALGGLRVGGALSIPGALFVVLMALVVEWFARRLVDVE